MCVCVCECVCVCVCVCVCASVGQRKTNYKKRADCIGKKVPIPIEGIRICTSGMRAHRASDYTTRARPPRVSQNKHFRHPPVSSTAKQSCMKHSNSHLPDRDIKRLQGPPLSRTKRVRERRKTELTVWGKRVPIPIDGIRTSTSGMRAHCGSDYTTGARPPRVSRNKHFRHPPVSSTTKQSCMKHSNSYLPDRDVKRLQGPPLSRTKRVRERRKTELTVWGKKVSIALDGIRTSTSGIRTHRASDYTTRAKPLCVCMRAQVCLCAHVCMHGHVYVCLCVGVCVFVCVCLGLLVCVGEWVWVCACVRTCACVCVRVTRKKNAGVFQPLHTHTDMRTQNVYTEVGLCAL